MARVKSSQLWAWFWFLGSVSCFPQFLPTKRAPDAGDSTHTSSSFLRRSIFLAGRLRRPYPSAGNANRWASALYPPQKPHNERKSHKPISTPRSINCNASACFDSIYTVIIFLPARRYPPLNAMSRGTLGTAKRNCASLA